ncbi:putative enzyme related to lactoylglutathione lyase [Kribbella voronezhensis]|uniref:Putative enzyme related to lactoylglutathione lyase n=1 Tax=Kribbella voronezhensis TaxID=2512212 RepID=A0A4V3FIZ9_9ACTN|nr:VOC family protein [Kribbella voronezhensis]TDU84393.1 putative enzyme related to lactoylglutathione lyase [Kribbella voronezhensis]
MTNDHPTSTGPIKGLDELEVITLLVDDVAACREFYTGVFGLKIIFEDANSALLKMRNLMLNLVTIDEEPLLIGAGAAPTPGGRVLYTIRVDDIDATAAALQAHGGTLLNGPIDRPWGRRTAAFPDPAGNLWEIAQTID